VTIRIWSAETDTLPRPVGQPGGETVDVTLLVGTWSDDGAEPAVEVDVEFSGHLRTFRGAEVEAVPAEYLDLFPGGTVREQSRRDPVGLDEDKRWFIDLCRRAQRNPGNRYHRVVVPDVPRGAWLEYGCRVVADDQPVAATCRYGLHAGVPEFGSGDLRASHTPGGEDASDAADGTWWVLFHRQEGGLDHFRVDLLGPRDDDDARPDLVVEVGDRRLDVGGPRPGPGEGPVWVPVIDRCADSVTFSAPSMTGPTASASTAASGASTPRPVVQVVRGGVRSGQLVLDDPPKPARLLLLNYCIQGFNDLFEIPEYHHSPPKTYMGIAMLDEGGLYSSRPFRAENGEPDGYALLLRAQRRWNVPSHWALNAGVLLMWAHDCPEELERLRQDVATGLVSPSNAGFGAHRQPYYACRTNLEELRRGAEFITGTVGRCDTVHYPDQRIYKAEPEAEIGSYAAYARLVPDRGPHYLVMDRSTVCHREGDKQVQYFPDDGTSGAKWTADTFALGNRLWRDTGTGYRLLLIEDALRDKMLDQSADELAAGKMPLFLRRMLMKAVSDRGQLRPLFCCGDDVDKWVGAGWFDGAPDDQGPWSQFANRYQASLAWISRHPWVQAVTTADLDRDPGGYGDLTVSSATCPSVDPGGGATHDAFGKEMHFDTWHDTWKDFRAPWLGRTLAELTAGVEQELIGTRPDEVDGDLYDLAWSAFLANTHESFWGTQPLESPTVNEDAAYYPPEDFVIAESLHLRNALVYRNAARWARAAESHPDASTHVDTGWLLDAVPDLKWDGDLLPNVLLYNDQALLVLDRNGGRITHIFVRQGGRAFCVSGTPMAYQWYGPAEVPQSPSPEHFVEWFNCDGAVLENTVWTPNHAYVACDSALARPRLGWKHDFRTHRDRPEPDRVVRWLFPDTFNAYDGGASGEDAVTFTYQAGTDECPAELDDRAFYVRCERDRIARTTGEGTPVVWHDPEHVGFTKTIRLSGRTIEVGYRDVRPGHVVANEFSVHLKAAMLGARFHRKEPADDGRSVALCGEDGVTVVLRLGDGCEFTPGALRVDGGTDLATQTDHLRLHRVLTDNLELRSPGGGAFSYRIELAAG
jgi:hypothetical protein